MLSQNNNALGIIFPNSYDNTVPELVTERTMASIPFAGRYRMVDFMLSSMANCGISNVSIVVRKNDNYTLTVDADGRVTELLFNDYRPGVQNLDLNIYVLERETLIKLVKDATSRGLIYFERDILAHNVNILNIRALEYTGYVAHVCDMKSYFDENLKLIDEKNLNALFPKESPVYTKIRDDNPVRYVNGSSVSNSLLADGCVIEGTVENCVLFRGVRVKKGAVVRNCVLMQDTVVEPGAQLDCVVTDKNVRVTADKKLSGTESFPVYVQKNHTV